MADRPADTAEGRKERAECWTPLRLIAAALGSERDAGAVLAALDAAGYACVPKVPTEKMLYDAAPYIYGEDGPGTWAAMITAATKSEN